MTRRDKACLLIGYLIGAHKNVRALAFTAIGYKGRKERMKPNDPNHECPDMPENFRVRNEKYPEGHWRKTGWRLIEFVDDRDWDTSYFAEVVTINYCPFCGERLEGER